MKYTNKSVHKSVHKSESGVFIPLSRKCEIILILNVHTSTSGYRSSRPGSQKFFYNTAQTVWNWISFFLDVPAILTAYQADLTVVTKGTFFWRIPE